MHECPKTLENGSIMHSLYMIISISVFVE